MNIMKKHTMRKAAPLLALALTTGMTAGCGASSVVNGVDVSQEDVQAAMQGADVSSLPAGHVKGGAAVHDPSIIKAEDGTYWIFGSHMAVAKSDDLRQWSGVFANVSRHNKLFSNLFADDSDAFAWVGKNSEGGYSVWAPDVIYNKKMQKYCMYFCTSSTYIKSSLCWATSDTINGPYEYQGRLIDSGFTRLDAKKGKVDILDYCEDELDFKTRYLNLTDYNNTDWPNAIDPTVFYDADGKMWMVYGSWSGGIFILEIDEETGLPIHPERDDENGVDAYFGKRLIGGGHQSCEGPWIQYDAASGYYYLFVSYGSLTANGGYQIRLFRSRNPDGPYEDAAGQTLGYSDHEKYGVKMMGNYTFPTLDTTYMAPGHNSAFEDTDGKLYLVYHQRFSDQGETHEPRVHQLFRTAGGWLVAAPFETNGETIAESGYDLSDVIGSYYVVNHGTDISDAVPEDVLLSLQPDGGIYVVEDADAAGSSDKSSSGSASAQKKSAGGTSDGSSSGDTKEEKAVRTNSAVTLGEKCGSFSLTEDSPYVTLTIDDATYEGVMIQMQDEADNPVMCFTACGENNETVWGVHYLAE